MTLGRQSSLAQVRGEQEDRGRLSISQCGPRRSWRERFPGCSAHMGHMGAAQGCMSVAPPSPRAGFLDSGKNREGDATPVPIPSPDTFSAKHVGHGSSLGKVASSQKAIKRNADLKRPLAILQVPHPAQKLGKPGLRESQTTCSGSSRSPSSQFSSLSRRSRPPSREHCSMAGYQGGKRNSLCTPRIRCLDGRLLGHIESNQRHTRQG